MALFDDGMFEEFLLCVWNFQMTLEDLGALAASAKIQYLRTILHGDVLRQLDTLTVEVGSTNTTHLIRIIFCLGVFFFPINMMSKQKHVMRHGMTNMHELKVIHYIDRMIKLNEYLATIPGLKASEKIVET